MTEIPTQNLSNDPITLIEQLSEAMGQYFAVCEEVTSAKKVLTEAIAKNQLPKTQGVTENDRKIHTDFKVREEQEAYDKLEDYKSGLKMMISLGQTILNYLKEERKVSGMGL
jgi:hypothetical protein